MPKAFVTGGSRGIGFAIAKKLAEEGYSVTITGRNQTRLEESVKLLSSKEGQHHKFIVADHSDINNVVDVDEDADVLVNNAGTGYVLPFEESPLSKTVEVINTNFTSVFLITQKFVANLLKHNKGGDIVTIGSVAATNAFPQGAAYAGSKGAVNSFTLALAKELGPKGIKANVVAPGATATDATVGYEVITQLNAINKGHFVAASSVADAAWSLISNPSVTGTIFTIDNGSYV